MIHFHAVMIDETGCEFGADIEANNRSEAYVKLREEFFPESRCVNLERTDEPEDDDVWFDIWTERDDEY